MGFNPLVINNLNKTVDFQGIQATSQKGSVETPVKGKAKAVAQKQLTYFSKLGNGKSKMVLYKSGKKSLGREIEKFNQNNAESVYYIPRKSLLNSKAKELRKEVRMMRNFIRKFKKQNHGKTPNYLAMDLKYTSEDRGKQDKKINGEYTVKVPKADGNGESFVRQQQSSRTLVNCARDLLSGYAELHSLGYAYGDPKLENLLIFKETNSEGEEVFKMKLADFGKARNTERKSKTYQGNTRMMPPEGRLSQKGDVYGEGLMLIRIFEENYLPTDKSRGHKEKFRGIEKEIVTSPHFLGASGKFQGLLSRVKALFFGSASSTKKNQVVALNKYIMNLEKQLRPFYAKEAVDALIRLIKEMTALDPKRRPSAMQALERFQAIKFRERDER